MSRIIKFRAWDKVNKRFFQEDEIVLEFLSGKFAEPAEISLHTFNKIFQDNKYVEWQQFTGRTDRNGKEIYVHDIVGVDDPEDKSRGMIVSHQGAFKVQLFTDRIAPLYDYPIGDTWVVIGNRYENPDLLP